MCRQADLYTPGSPIRRLLIKAACLDVERYFRPPDEIVMHEGEEHRSELDWLLNFGSGQTRDRDCCYFLLIYRRHLDTKWKLHRLANMVRLWASQSVDFTFGTFETRVTQLQTRRTNRSREGSVATKLSFFANPMQAVFISDKFARLAVGYRHPLRVAQCGYPSSAIGEYLQAARDILSCELNRCDFRRAVRTLIPMLDPVQHSVFRDDETAMGGFAARRVLDKLMYYEGRLLGEHHDDPCGDAAQQLVSEWIEVLERDIAAAEEANRHLDAAD